MASTSTLSFQFRITGIEDQSFNTRTRQNVKKRIASIRYLEELPADAVRLAFVGSKELSPANNLFIADRSDSIYSNTRTNTIREIVTSHFPVDVKNENFLVTQEFADSEADDIPLYYKHVLSSDIIPESVRVFDQDYQPVSQDKYKLVLQYDYSDTGVQGDVIEYHLYNSLENSFDLETTEYEVYFVQYTQVVSGIESTSTELLNNEKAYSLATFEDVWPATLSLYPWSRAYLLDNLSLTLPSTGKAAIRYEEQARIGVQQPVALDNTSPWFARVSNGSFRHGYAGTTLLYSIPEFSSQAFNPIEPYKLAVRVSCSKIDDRLIKLPHDNIQSGSLFSYLYLILENNGDIVYAITDDPGKIGTDYTDIEGSTTTDSDGNTIQWSSDYLLGTDQLSGIVHLGVDVDDAYDILATYSYEETTYELTGLNMNPLFDSDIHNELRVVYLVPQATANGNLGVQTKAIEWIKVSSTGKVQSTSQDGSGYNENINSDVALTDSDGYKLSGAIGLYYNKQANTTVSQNTEILLGGTLPAVSTSTFPAQGWIRVLDDNSHWRYMYYTSKTSTGFVLSSDTTKTPDSASSIDVSSGVAIELVNFIDERTVLTRRTSSDESSYAPSSVTASCFSQYFILGELVLNPPHGLNEATMIDVRKDGGGIDPDLYNDAKVLNPRVQWIADRGTYEGQIYPGKAVAVVKVPYTLLDTFSLEYIKEIAKDNLPFGVYPLIRFYGYKPRIIRTLPCSKFIAVEWEKEGAEFVYNVWYAQSEDGPWVRHNDRRIVDDPVRPYNLYILDGLTDEQQYLVKITMEDKYYKWWHSYANYNSIGGGYGLDEDAPSPPFGNVANFQFQIIV